MAHCQTEAGNDASSIMPFGKYEGTSFKEFSKRTFRAYLERHQRGYYTYLRHKDLYCKMHTFAEGKWPDWARTLCLLCECKRMRRAGEPTST